jgi:hypothetical protein
MANKTGIIEEWKVVLYRDGVQKSVRIELYPAYLFREKFDIYDRSRWSPKPSFQSVARERYFNTRYRVKLDGKWFGEKAKYTMFDLDQVYQKVVKKIGR